MSGKQAREVIDLFRKTSCLLHSREIFGNVPRGEFFILSMLYDLENNSGAKDFRGITVTQLAKRLDMSKAAVSKLLRVIEQKKHITRTLCDDDHRVVYIRLSEAGRVLLLDSLNRTETVIGGLLTSLGEADTRELVRILRNLLKVAENSEVFHRQKAGKEITQG